MKQKLKIHFRGDLATNMVSHSLITIPFEGKKINGYPFYNQDVYEGVIHDVPDLYEFTSLKDADIVLDEDENSETIKEACQLQKHIVIIYPRDDGHMRKFLVGYDNKTILKRSTLFGISKPRDDFTFPSFPHTPWLCYEKNYQVPISPFRDKPLITFTGNCDRPVIRQNFINEMNGLKKRCKFECKHIQWWQSTEEERRSMRQPYIDQMCNSNYVLSVRGVGNFSFRLYESLSLGKPIVHLKTDARLPFGMRYENVGVVTTPRDMKNMDLKISAHYKRFTEDGWVEYQKHIFDIWKKNFSPEVFHRKVYDLLIERI